ncbi:expressed protein [Phakopsora pachyrhizi]|uniref:Expressed protein n=1 Tax=Phakopsora pachyrhizi TaxID=170000 RepID=A0AAV0BNK5_PHAPC|nr:expressed protein [Phakopsora pachyrhizi]
MEPKQILSVPSSSSSSLAPTAKHANHNTKSAVQQHPIRIIKTRSMTSNSRTDNQSSLPANMIFSTQNTHTSTRSKQTATSSNTAEPSKTRLIRNKPTPNNPTYSKKSGKKITVEVTKRSHTNTRGPRLASLGTNQELIDVRQNRKIDPIASNLRDENCDPSADPKPILSGSGTEPGLGSEGHRNIDEASSSHLQSVPTQVSTHLSAVSEPAFGHDHLSSYLASVSEGKFGLSSSSQLSADKTSIPSQRTASYISQPSSSIRDESFSRPPSKPRKRLFEEMDNGSNQDIFSFLDSKPRAMKGTKKPSRRPVFKNQKPFVPQADRETKSLSNKRHALASNKLIFGIPGTQLEPNVKRLKKDILESGSTQPLQKPQNNASSSNSSESSSQSSNIQSTGETPATEVISPNSDQGPEKKGEIPALILIPSPKLNLPSQEELESQALKPKIATNPEEAHGFTDSCLTYSSSKDSNLPDNCFLRTSTLPTSTQHSLDTSPVALQPPVKRAYEASCDSNLPIIGNTSSCLMKKQEGAEEETSNDDIDFLSPQKRSKIAFGNYSNRGESHGEASELIDGSPLIISVLAEPRGTEVNEVITLKEPRSEAATIGLLAEQAQVDRAHSKADSRLNSPPTPKSNVMLSTNFQPKAPLNSGSTKETFENFQADSSVDIQTAHITTECSMVSPFYTPKSSPVALEPAVLQEEHQGSSRSSDGAVTPEPKLSSLAGSPPKSSPRLIPTRQSPIKEATLPTSIPIVTAQLPRSTPTKIPTLKWNSGQPSRPSQSAPAINMQTKPSMLPRRVLKPSLGTCQPFSLSAAPGLDCIVENSPEKRPTRDAMSAASLNLFRGPGIPPRMIFTGGIQAKSNLTLSRLPKSSSAQVESPSVSELFLSKLPPLKKEENRIQDMKAEAKGLEEPLDESDKYSELSELSELSIETSQSGDQSNNSVASSGYIENSSSSSANISLETQGRLSKLQDMLNRLGGSRQGENNSFKIDNAQNLMEGKPRYVEYEVALKDEDSDKGEISKSKPTKGRSGSVSSNPLSKSVSGNDPSKGLSQSASSKSKTQRRVSNILPRAQIGSEEETALQAAQKGVGDSNLSSSSGQARKDNKVEKTKKMTPLKDVIAYVDVRTADGDDAGKVFVEMLKALGAKVLGRPTFPLTHIIFKAGKQATIDRWLIHPRPKPFLVGIGWIVRCREILTRASEKPYEIDINTAQIMSSQTGGESSKNLGSSNNSVGSLAGGVSGGGGGISNRRKSMEPKALSMQADHFDRSSKNLLSRSCIGE